MTGMDMSTVVTNFESVFNNLTNIAGMATNQKYEPRQILISGNRTIVFWKDGTKTIVKCADDKEFNVYVAFTAALSIKIFGSNTHLKKVIREKTAVQKKKVKVVDD